MGRKWIALLCCILAVLMATPVIAGCGGGEEETEAKTIVIGDLTDLTGPAANAMTPISWSLQDYCSYVNSEGLIPNVTLEVVQYDTKYDTQRFSLGYDYVKSQGATVIWTGFPGCAEALKTRAEVDGIAIIEASASVPVVDTPGSVFCEAGLMRGIVPAELEWVYEEDWEGAGPATIGMASWNVAPNPDTETALKKYCQENPDQFTLVGASLVPAGTMTWSGEVDKYKNCDYLWFGSGGAVGPSTFIDQYRAAGGKATIVSGGGTLCSYVGAITDKAGWANCDGLLESINWAWWTYDSDQVRLATRLLQENHPGEAPSMINRQALSGLINAEVAVELLRAVVKEIGTKDLSSRAIYEGLQQASVTLPGFEKLDYSQGSREGMRYFQMWKWSAADQNLMLVSDWIPNAE